MPHTPSTDPHFLNTLRSWLEQDGEVLTLFRYANRAGSRDWQLWRDPQALASKIAQLPPLCSISAFRGPRLPIRGVVDPQFIERCKQAIPNGEEFLVLDQHETSYEYPHCSWATFHYTAGVSHEELTEELKNEDWNGKLVAVGPYPPFWNDDSPEMVTAYAPDENGNMSGGAY